MRSRTLVACAFVLLLVPTGVSGVVGFTELSATLPDNRVTPGEQTRLQVQITNTGTVVEGGPNPRSEAQVTTARGVRAEVTSGDAPISVETGTASLGAIPNSGVARMGVAIEVDEDATPGRYRVPVDVRYDVTSEIDGESHHERTVRDTLHVTIRVEDAARFRIVDAGTDASVGEAGNVSLALRNVGSDTARDARVTVQSRSPDFLVGANGSASRFVGAWAPGETRTVVVPGTADPGAGRWNYTVVARVDYTEDGDAAVRSRPLATGVVPAPEQRFEFDATAQSLYLGERAVVSGTIRNAGPDTARDAVVRIETSNDTVVPVRPEHVVGTLAPNESATVAFPVRVADAGTAGVHQFDVGVTYRTPDGDRRESDPLSGRVSVDPDRDTFALETPNATVAPDSSNRVVVRVTNTGDAPRTDVAVSLAPTPPFSSVAPDAYVGELAPGESERVAFELAVDEDAVASSHALVANVTSESADGVARTESYRVRVDVARETTSVDTATAVGVGVLGLAIVGGLGYWWYRRR